MGMKRMRGYLALAPGVAFLALASGAQADGPFGHPVVEPTSEYGFVPPYSWTGFYFGGNLGGAWSGATLTDRLTGLAFDGDNSGFIGGVQGGYNYQIRDFVIGAEWDIDWTSLSHRSSAVVFPAPVAATLQESGST